MSEGIWVALISGGIVLGSGALAWFGKLLLNCFGQLIGYLADISKNSTETKVEVQGLKMAISSGTEQVGRVVHSVENLTNAVNQHNVILKDHDDRLIEVERLRPASQPRSDS